MELFKKERVSKMAGEVSIARENRPSTINATKTASSRIKQSPFVNMDWHKWGEPYTYYATITRGRKDDIGRNVDFITTEGYSSIHDGIWRKLGYSNMRDDRLELEFKYIEDRNGKKVWEQNK